MKTKVSAYDFWDKRIPTVIVGNEHLPVITISMGGSFEREEDIRFAIFGGEIINRDKGDYEIVARDPNGGTDIEHDTAYLARLKLSGVEFSDMFGGQVSFRAHLIDADYYGPGETYTDHPKYDGAEKCDRCKSGHLIGLPFSPPEKTITPVKVNIAIKYLSKSDRKAYLAERLAITTPMVERNRALRASRQAEHDATQSAASSS